ncbi:hypothetical protein AAY473_023431, partial [Plecturocebus cupreus]
MAVSDLGSNLLLTDLKNCCCGTSKTNSDKVNTTDGLAYKGCTFFIGIWHLLPTGTSSNQLTCKASAPALRGGDGPKVPGVCRGRVEGQGRRWRERERVALPGEAEPLEDTLAHLLYLGSLLSLEVKDQHVKMPSTSLGDKNETSLHNKTKQNKKTNKMVPKYSAEVLSGVPKCTRRRSNGSVFTNLAFKNLALSSTPEYNGAILAHCNLRLLGSSDSPASASQVGGIIKVHHHIWLIFVLLIESCFHHVGHAGLELVASCDPPALASQSAGITGIDQHIRPLQLFLRNGLLYYTKIQSETVQDNAKKLINYLELLELIRLVEFGGQRLSQEGIQLLTPEDACSWPLHHVPARIPREQTLGTNKKRNPEMKSKDYCWPLCSCRSTEQVNNQRWGQYHK